VRNKNNTLLALPFVAMVFFAFYGIRSRSMWLDEAFTVLASFRSLSGVINEIKYDSAPPLYYMVLSLWSGLFGMGETAVRGLSGMFYIANVFVMYLLAKSLLKSRYAGYLAALLFMASPLAIRHAQNARMYSLLSLLAALSIYCFFRIVRDGAEKKAVAVYLAVNVLGTFTHYWFWFPLFGQGVAALLLYRRQFLKVFAFTTLSVVPFFVLWAPVVAAQRQRCGTTWIPKPGAAVFYQTVADFYGRGTSGYLVLAVFVLLVLVNIAMPFRLKLTPARKILDQAGEKINLALIVIIAISLLLAFAVSHALQPVFIVGRYTIAVLPAFTLLVVSFLSKTANPVLTVIVCFFLVAGSGAGLLVSRNQVAAESDRNTATELINRAEMGDAIIYTSLSHAAVEYYLKLFGKDAFFKRYSFPMELMQHMGWRDIPGMLSQKDSLLVEADSLVGRLKQDLGAGNGVWLLYGYDVEVSAPVKEALDAGMVQTMELPVAGPFHKKIFVYKKKPLLSRF